MNEGYWKWLKLNLSTVWNYIKIVPFVIWDLGKWISNDLKKMTYSLIKNEVKKIFTWENICAGTGAIGLTGLIFWLLALGTGQLKSLTMFWWGIGEMVLFFVSTYAHWRDTQ